MQMPARLPIPTRLAAVVNVKQDMHNEAVTLS